MVYIDSFVFPSDDDINGYFYQLYPWNIFFENGFKSLVCKDITIFYGNNGSGKSTLLNILSEKIEAQRDEKLFKDVVYMPQDHGDVEVHPFDDFLSKTHYKMGLDDSGERYLLPQFRKVITSEDIFRKIDNRRRHNNKALLDIDRKRSKRNEILNKGYQYKGIDDCDDLLNLLEARKLSKREYANRYAESKEKMQSNGETALSIYSSSFEDGGIYFLDEPENCLSPVFQIELIDLILQSSKYFDCQFFISTHSPLLLSLKNAVVYNLDARPVIEQDWTTLENVLIYYDFFMAHKGEFEK